MHAKRRLCLPALVAGLVIGILADRPLSAQPPEPTAPDRPSVFLDCERFCDFDFLRRTIGFVDWVRNRDDAQIHLLVTQQGTGAGGSRYTLYYIGQHAFASLQDTLQFSVRQDDTDDERRSALARTMALGLVPFAARTTVGRDLDVIFEQREGELRLPPAQDPWNFWVFRLRLGGSAEGESRETSLSADGSVSANRVTEDLKIEIRAFGEYEREEFELDEEDAEDKLIATSRNFDVNGLIVWSLGPHWSLGATAAASASTQVNQDLRLNVAPAIEYSVYPYAESSRRQITALYTIGPVRYDYEEITAFERTEETRIEQSLEFSAGFQQPWGEIDASLEWSNYMHDFGLHRIDFFSGVEVRLFRGFSLDVRGNVARVKNQIYIPLEEIPIEDVLLGRRRLGTDFEYEIDVGVSFTFGSVLNNVVNPRLNRGGGGRDFF